MCRDRTAYSGAYNRGSNHSTYLIANQSTYLNACAHVGTYLNACAHVGTYLNACAYDCGPDPSAYDCGPDPSAYDCGSDV
jgi:hypothetical protein